MARLKDHYNEVLTPAQRRVRLCKNPMQVPKLDKIVLNMGVGEAVAGQEEDPCGELTLTPLPARSR